MNEMECWAALAANWLNANEIKSSYEESEYYVKRPNGQIKEFGLCDSIHSLNYIGKLSPQIAEAMIKKIKQFGDTNTFIWPHNINGRNARVAFARMQYHSLRLENV